MSLHPSAVIELVWDFAACYTIGMSLSKLFAPDDDPDSQEPMTREDWRIVALEVGPPALVAAAWSAWVTIDLVSAYGKHVLTLLDPFILLGITGFVVFWCTAWWTAKKRRGRK